MDDNIGRGQINREIVDSLECPLLEFPLYYVPAECRSSCDGVFPIPRLPGRGGS